MNLLDILKQFKNIEPASAFTATSKRDILAQNNPVAAWSAKKTFFHIIETGAAVALTGFFILLLSGAFSNSQLAPVKYSVIDPQGLRAEAQAIDIQIELAKLNYQGGKTAESTPKSAKPLPTSRIFGGVPGSSSTSTNAPATTATSTPTSTAASPTTSTPSMSIDQVLEKLSN
jgi:hypothetical protein